MRRALLLLAATLLALGGLAPAAASAAPYCGITWGSGEKAAGPATPAAPLTNVRAGRHDCYDRLVVDLGPGGAGYLVRYVPQFTQDFSGEPIPLRGAADLEVIVNAPAYDQWYNPTWDPADPREAVDVTGYQTFRQVVYGSSWEGQTQIGLGVRARLPFRVSVLPGPGAASRLVIDVAHAW